MADDFDLENYIPDIWNQDPKPDETAPYTPADEEANRRKAAEFVKSKGAQPEKPKPVHDDVEDTIKNLSKQMAELAEKNSKLQSDLSALTKSNENVTKAVNTISDREILEIIENQTVALLKDEEVSNELVQDVVFKDKKGMYDFMDKQAHERGYYFQPEEIMAIKSFRPLLKALIQSRRLEAERGSLMGVEKNYEKRKEGLDIRSEEDKRKAILNVGRKYGLDS